MVNDMILQYFACTVVNGASVNEMVVHGGIGKGTVQ